MVLNGAAFEFLKIQISGSKKVLILSVLIAALTQKAQRVLDQANNLGANITSLMSQIKRLRRNEDMKLSFT